MSHILKTESCTLWWPPGIVTACFLAEKLPDSWDPRQRPRPPSLVQHGCTAQDSVAQVTAGTVPKFFGGVCILIPQRGESIRP